MIKIIQKHPVYSILIIYLLTYLVSLTFLYVEGDDAFTVAYHIYGRNLDFQEPYSPYHGMMDTFFSLFPANEPLLRTLAIGISSIAALIFVLLIYQLLSKWLPEDLHPNLVFFLPLLPFTVPELLFFGLIYMPSVVAMTLILAGHLLIRQQFEKNNINLYQFTISLMLFGLGASCRWDTAVYGIVIFIDVSLLLINQKRIGLQSLVRLGIWSLLAIASVVFFIYLSGYTPAKIGEIFLWAKSYLSAKPSSMLKKASVVIALLTPAFVICFLIGLLRLILEGKWKILLLGTSGYLPKLYLGLTLLPKAMIMALPGFFLITYTGFDFILKQKKPYIRLKKRQLPLFTLSLLLVILIPWVIGVHIDARNTSWGPGFEVFYKPANLQSANKSVDQKIQLDMFRLSFSGGFASPTSEGPRPVWGFGSVLLGGQWRAMMVKRTAEIDSVIQYANQHDLPILQNNKFMLVMINLMRDGYKQETVPYKNDAYQYRNFIPDKNNKRTQNEIAIFIMKPNVIFNEASLQRAMTLIGYHKLVCWFNTSADIAKLKETYPDQVKVLGPFSAILEFRDPS